MLKKMQTLAMAAGIGLIGASIASAAIVDEGFEGLATMGEVTPAQVAANTSVVLASGGSVYARDYGSLSDVSVETKNGAAFATASAAATPTTTQFSMDIGSKIGNSGNGVTTNHGAGAGFGWSTDSDAINDYGAGAGNVTFGVAKTNNVDFNGGTPTIRLSYQNNTATNGPTQFGTAEIALTENTWYHLTGTITRTYNSGTNITDFDVTLSLYDMGTEGSESAPGTLVLTGTDTFSYTGDWSTARAVYFTNASRGFNYMDNLYTAAVPEPASLALIAGGLMLIGSRRRKQG